MLFRMSFSWKNELWSKSPSSSCCRGVIKKYNLPFEKVMQVKKKHDCFTWTQGQKKVSESVWGRERERERACEREKGEREGMSEKKERERGCEWEKGERENELQTVSIRKQDKQKLKINLLKVHKVSHFSWISYHTGSQSWICKGSWGDPYSRSKLCRILQILWKILISFQVVQVFKVATVNSHYLLESVTWKMIGSHCPGMFNGMDRLTKELQTLHFNSIRLTDRRTTYPGI